ncbi:MAG: hypothetical protein J0I62_11190, partial [Microbacterium sp.]|nr:hypothetical protein [Microbacterium sp.]
LGAIEYDTFRSRRGLAEVREIYRGRLTYPLGSGAPAWYAEKRMKASSAVKTSFPNTGTSWSDHLTLAQSVAAKAEEA